MIASETSAPGTFARSAPWQERRDLLHTWLKTHPLTRLTEEEIEVHLRMMPARYWEHVSESELVWVLETTHAFLESLGVPDASGARLAVAWRHFPEHGFTKVILSTWDRHGLLAKVAAAFAAVHINILQADVYTRADNLVVDIFRVCDWKSQHVAHSARLQEMVFLLEGALSEPPRFASIWACSRHKFLAEPGGMTPLVSLDNRTSPDCTLLRVQASDRLGLLYDILLALADAGLNITQAVIDTDEGVADDTFHLTDRNGEKIADPSQLTSIRRSVLEAIGT